MAKDSKARRGQAVIIVALFVSAVIVSMALAISRTSTEHQLLRSYSYNEVVNDIDQDLSRTLERILAEATRIFVGSADFDPSRLWAKDFFTYYVKSLLNAYSGIGLQVNIDLSRSLVLQPQKELKVDINGVTKTFTINERKITDLIKAYWYSPESISAIYVPFAANVTGYGFYGWRKEVLLSLTLDILSIRTSTSKKLTNLTFRVLREGGEPVGSLRAQDISVLIYDPGETGKSCWTNASVVDLSYNGGGNYSVVYNNPSSWGGYALNRSQYVFLRVKDDRGIYVEAASFTGINLVIKENIAPTKVYAPDQIYVFEMLQDGSIYWFGEELKESSGVDFAPLPPLPVKQFRVFATTKGTSGNIFEVPYQVETWTPDYTMPTPNFADWRRRFDVGNKLVFMVNYTQDPSSVVDDTKQRVFITWFDDTDAQPPTYKVVMNVSGAWVTYNVSRYYLELVARPGYSNWIDFSISMWAKTGGYHIEYMLVGYDVYRMSGGGYWFPKKLPGGDWVTVTGPIRGVAYRENSIIVVPPLTQSLTDEHYHREYILIPFNTPYFTWQYYGRWLKNTQLDYRYLSVIGQISGTSGDQGSSIRPKYCSIQLDPSNPNTKPDRLIINGSYHTSNVFHRDLGISIGGGKYQDADNYGYWIAQYNEGFGQGVFIPQATREALRNFDKSGKDIDEVWAWTTADYARRVSEFDALDWDYENAKNYNVNKDTELSVRAAIWLFSGGTVPVDYYQDPKDWANQNAYKSSTAVKTTDLYYKMFLEDYRPTVMSITVG
jgi:hypothetical protein